MRKTRLVIFRNPQTDEPEVFNAGPGGGAAPGISVIWDENLHGEFTADLDKLAGMSRVGNVFSIDEDVVSAKAAEKAAEAQAKIDRTAASEALRGQNFTNVKLKKLITAMAIEYAKDNDIDIDEL